jgi:hypothetical protein
MCRRGVTRFGGFSRCSVLRISGTHPAAALRHVVRYECSHSHRLRTLVLRRERRDALASRGVIVTRYDDPDSGYAPTDRPQRIAVRSVQPGQSLADALRSAAGLRTIPASARTGWSLAPVDGGSASVRPLPATFEVFPSFCYTLRQLKRGVERKPRPTAWHCRARGTGSHGRRRDG